MHASHLTLCLCLTIACGPASMASRQKSSPEAAPYHIAPEVLRAVGVRSSALLDRRLTLTEEVCRSLVGWSGSFDNCWMHPLANGTAAVLVIQTECYGDGCSAESWLYADGKSKPTQQVPEELSLDHRFAFVEEGMSDDGSPVVNDMRLLRQDRRTGESVVFAQCMAPMLSPGSHWIVCRDRLANVVRVPVGGGPAEVIAESKLTKDQVNWVDHWYDYPAPVTFHGATLTYSVQASPHLDEQERAALTAKLGRFTIPWVE